MLFLKPQTLTTRISQQRHSNFGWRNPPYLSRTYAAIPRTWGSLPWHNKTGRPNPGTSNSHTCRKSETKVSEHNSISYWDEAMARSLRFPDRPCTLLQSILQLAATGRHGPGLLSTSGNLNLRHKQNFKCRVHICYGYIDTTIRKDQRGRADTMAMLPPPPTKHIAVP